MHFQIILQNPWVTAGPWVTFSRFLKCFYMFPGDPPIPPPPPHTHTTHTHTHTHTPHTHTHTVTSLQRLYERNVLKWSSSHTVRVLSDRCASASASGRVLPFLSWLEDIFTHYVHSCLPVSSGSLSLECKSSKPAVTLHREAPASLLALSLSLSLSFSRLNSFNTEATWTCLSIQNVTLILFITNLLYV